MCTMKRAKLDTPPPVPPRARLLPRVLATLRRLRAGGRRGLRSLLRQAVRQPGYLRRVLGRLGTRARTRRQDKTGTGLP